MAEPERTVRIKDFIDDNKDMLTILGVFIAIAAFSANLSVKLVGAFISIPSITCAALIAFEIWRWPSKSGRHSLVLTFFSVALFGLTLSLLVYCLYFFDAIYPDILFPILTLVFAELEVLLAEKLSNKFEKAKKAIEWYRKSRFWRFAITIAIVLITISFARFIANRVDVPLFKAVVWVATISNNIKGPIQ